MHFTSQGSWSTRTTGVLVVALLVVVSGQAQATQATSDELAETRFWITTHFNGSDTGKLPFSFVYDGRSSVELLPDWELTSQVQQLEPRTAA